MARHRNGSWKRRKRRSRNRGYVIAVLVVISGGIACVYNSFGKNNYETSAVLVDAEIENSIQLPALVPPMPEPQPELTSPEGVSVSPKEARSPIAEVDADVAVSINTQPATIIEERDGLNTILQDPQSTQQHASVKKRLSELTDSWLFGRTVYPGDRLCTSYRVRPGDLLSTIGKQYKVPYQILLRINSINRPEALRAGETIKVIRGPFHGKIYRSTFTMDLYLQDTFVRSFPVVLGRPGMETPTGRWLVKRAGKLISPTWTHPATGKTYEPQDPDYPLGSRWIGLEGIDGAAKDRTGFAIHGTKKKAELRKASSRGCIRLYDEDVMLVYDLLTPGLSQVTIVE